MTIDVTGIEDVIQQLSNQQFKEKSKVLLERLAEIGVEVASREYSRSSLDLNEPPSVRWYSVNDSSVCIVASGKDVLFLEFGTGITYNAGNPYPDDSFKPIYMMGDWSDNEALGGKHHWADPNGWWIPRPGQKALHTMGIPATRAMYEGKKEMQKSIQKLIEEIFI